MFTVKYQKTSRKSWKSIPGQFYSLQDAITLSTHLQAVVHYAVVEDDKGTLAYDASNSEYLNGYYPRETGHRRPVCGQQPHR